MRLLFAVVLSAATGLASSAGAAATATLYLDGGVVEVGAKAVKGYAEVALPASYLPDSLRVRPAGGATVARVDVVTVPPSPKARKEIERLSERIDSIRDRLKALETREEIFLAAAKSQSGKAPRRTKTNPEPLATIRQGTDYALGQLEEVYRLRRKAEQELKRVERAIASARASAGVGGMKARIRIAPGSADLAVSFIDRDLRWTPRYDLRVNSDRRAELALLATVPRLPKGTKAAVVPALLSAKSVLSPVPVTGDESPVSRYLLSPDAVESDPSPPSRLSFAFPLPAVLPPGEASCFRSGEYLGTISLSGGNAGEIRRVVCGRH